MNFDDLKRKVRAYCSENDLKDIEKAYEFALEKHRDHKRLSGDPYIIHPVAVANILAELEQDAPTICASLLHDTVEDSDTTIEDISKKFSPIVAKLVEGVTKLGQLIYDSKEEQQAENFRKMFMAMGEDLRVVIIKIADRLHNMQTLKWLPEQKIHEISLETRDIFAPLAHRLGMWRLKWELEDLSFKYLEPEEYKSIQEKISESRIAREEYIGRFIEKLSSALKELNIEGEVKGRPKHLYSICRKMVTQNLEFEQIYDLTAVRVIVPSLKDCYEVLGIIHANWKPIPGRFRDYIAVPKSNGYQSLHTTVVGDEGKPVEVQIRTLTMHRTAEYGVAAHWVYKETSTDKSFDKKMAWFRQMLEHQAEFNSAKDFMNTLKIDLFTDEVFVFTPRGKVIQLPQGATPVDFAYHVHTEIGHKCAGARVNGKIIPLDYKLKSGDIVEIIASKTGNPSLDWLNFVKTSGARTKIRNYFKKIKRDESLLRGEAAIDEELKKLHLIPKEALAQKNIDLLLKQFKLQSREDLYAAVGCGDISAFDCARKIFNILNPQSKIEAVSPLSGRRPRKRKIIHGVNVAGLSGIMVKISRCCRPLPGDEIVGFVTQGKGVAVHRKDCNSLLRNKPDVHKLVDVEWDLASELHYPVEIEIEAFDRLGVLKDILAQIVETKTNVESASTKTKRGSIAFLRLVIDVKNVEQLNKVIQAVKKVSDVYETRRCDIE